MVVSYSGQSRASDASLQPLPGDLQREHHRPRPDVPGSEVPALPQEAAASPGTVLRLLYDADDPQAVSDPKRGYAHTRATAAAKARRQTLPLSLVQPLRR